MKQIIISLKNYINKENINKWIYFFICVFCACVIFLLIINAISLFGTKSALIIKIKDYPATVLYEDINARANYLASRIYPTNFFVYTVKPGDNLWKIAKKFGYSVHTLIGCNPQLKTYNVSTNQNILVPSSGGCLHPIQKNDTWETIAQKYDIEKDTLINENFGILKLEEGKFVFIPGKKPAVDLMNEQMQEKYALRSLFISPLGGRLTSLFGKRKHPVTGQVSTHGGIDIAAPNGTWVAAAADGVVIVASTGVGHYGTAVFIDHQNGYITHYGHLSSYKVRVGQKVKAGQLIARSGATGRVTGPHLHFTVKKNGNSIDPLKFLW